jgi:inner membrane protein
VTGGKIGYLLHHRGHTHTLLGGVPLGLLAALAIMALAGQKERLVPADRRWLLSLGAIGPLVHVAMDGWNIYGVHPFWPIYNGWFYGDAVFIVEPLLWAVLVSLLFVGLGLPWLVGTFVPLAMRLALVGVAVAMGLVTWRLSPPRRALVAIAAFAAVAAGFFAFGALARSRLERALASAPEITTRDLALTSLPANPWCWSAVAVQTAPRDTLVLTRATVAAVPALWDVGRCPSLGDHPTAPLVPSRASDDAALRWEGEFRGSLAELRALAQNHCEVAAVLRFLRTPFFVTRPASIVVGDLRFDRDAEHDFAEIEVAPGATRCPDHLPPWTPPRSDLLLP